MKFGNPLFLYGLFAIAIPIIIHLFSFRKIKIVYFSNTRFLKSIKQETDSRSNLKHILILISRILAIASIVLAFAQPYIPIENKKIISGEKAISVFIDNSFSMESQSTSGALIDGAKRKAKEIAAAYKSTDKFQILTNDFEGKQQRELSKEEFLEELEQIAVSPASRKLNEVLGRQTYFLNHTSSLSKNAFIVSDFQKSFVDVQIKNDTSISTRLIPLEAIKQGNISIDSCWFENPVRQSGATEKLFIKVKNNSDKAAENVPIKLYINNQQKALLSFNAAAKSETILDITFPSQNAGINNCRIELNDYPITYDDAIYFSYLVAKNFKVISINADENKENERYLASVYKNDSTFIYKSYSEKQLNYSELSNKNLIILNEIKNISSGLQQELTKNIEKGTTVLIFPAKEAELSSYNLLLSALKGGSITSSDTAKSKADYINFENNFFMGIFERKPKNNEILDLPTANYYYKIQTFSNSNSDVLIKLNNNNSFLSVSNFGKGKVFICTSPLDDKSSNFVNHGLFAPILYKIAVSSQAENNLYNVIGENEIIEIEKKSETADLPIKITDGKEFETIPEQKNSFSKTNLFIHNQIQKAGNYFIEQSNEKLKGVSFNYNKNESDLNFYSSSELSEILQTQGLKDISVIENSVKSLTNELTNENEGKRLWKVCIILALIFLALETAIIRLFK